MDGPAQMRETELPPKDEFLSKLYGEHIGDEDYAHAQRVFKEFGCQTMQDYHNLYLKSDVAILEDIIENFRDICIENYGLDRMHYYPTPGLAVAKKQHLH